MPYRPNAEHLGDSPNRFATEDIFYEFQDQNHVMSYMWSHYLSQLARKHHPQTNPHNMTQNTIQDATKPQPGQKHPKQSGSCATINTTR